MTEIFSSKYLVLKSKFVKKDHTMIFFLDGVSEAQKTDEPNACHYFTVTWLIRKSKIASASLYNISPE